MKKFLIVSGITLAVIMVLLLVLPFLFQGKIKEIVKAEANRLLTVQVDFKSVNLSFIRNFPNATVAIKGLTLTGTEEFASDTLLQSKELSATVNLASLFGDGGYEVKKILIDKTALYAKILENGKANWDIMKSDSTETSPEDTTTTAFKLQLQKLTLNGVDITYEDLQSGMKAVVRNFSGTLKGDMTAEVTHLETQSSIESLTFIMDKIPYLSNINLTVDMALQADFAHQKYTVQHSSIGINAIRAIIDGWLSIPDSTKMEMDLKLETPKLQFKDLLSLIPVIYAKDFKGLQAEGAVQLLATAKGVMAGTSYPAYDVQLHVTDGRFQYPALPKSLNNIQINTHIYNPGGVLDNMVADISNIHFDLGGNPFDFRLKATHPLTDLLVDLSAKGVLNLGMVKDIYPLEKGMELNGVLNANLSFAGAMSSIEKGAYDKVQAAGTLNVKDLKLKSEDTPDVLIHTAAFAFNPKYADLSEAKINIGNNDISVSGKLENYLPYLLKDETIQGSLNVSSNYLNLNDFMTENNATPTPAETPAPLLAFEIPKNIRFYLNASLKEVLFDRIEMKNVAGTVVVADGKLDMKNLSMNALKGSMKVNGYYSTAKNPKQPDVNVGLNLQQVSFSETFKTFEFVQQLTPIFEHVQGTYSVDFNVRTLLTEDLSPVLTTLTGNGLLQSNNVTVSDVPALTALSTALKNDKFKTIQAKDLKISFAIADGRVQTSPFDLSLGGDTKMNLSGSTGLDQTIDYVAKVSLPDQLTKGKLSAVSVKIGGTFTSPKISVDTKSLVEDALSSALKDAGVKIPDANEVKADVQAAIEKQAAELRRKSQEAGDKLISEAEKQGQKLIEEANKTKNPLAKVAAVAAAESTAKQLKAEAQKQAEKLRAETEKQIEKLTGGTAKEQ
ncbi:MAG: AsmA family protein [Dysgonamonadaceae bacterium]|jgi:regulator of protease activity HflC (stomatin/prohibitin superfamily)|nr:AsmA family protein [Dysgonamonadaceae bacterium]